MHKRKKNTRQRGSMSHGWGSKKKHRGAGNRGGRGMAGTGKRADSKKPSIWDDPYYFGRHGFTKKNKKNIFGINVQDLDQQLGTLMASKKITKKNSVYDVSLELLGYQKLLGKGNIHHALQVTTLYASPRAIAKVAEAGGKVTVTLKVTQTAKKQSIGAASGSTEKTASTKSN